MLSNPFRIALVILFSLLAAGLAFAGKLMEMMFVLSVIFLLLYGYFRSGTVLLALRKMGRNDLDGAEKMLQQTRFPHRLRKDQKAYYHLIKGLLQGKHGNFKEAARALEKAIETGIPTPSNQAVAHLNLASVYINLHQSSAAKEHITQAKVINKSPVLAKEIEEIEILISDAN